LSRSASKKERKKEIHKSSTTPILQLVLYFVRSIGKGGIFPKLFPGYMECLRFELEQLSVVLSAFNGGGKFP